MKYLTTRTHTCGRRIEVFEHFSTKEITLHFRDLLTQTAVTKCPSCGKELTAKCMGSTLLLDLPYLEYLSQADPDQYAINAEFIWQVLEKAGVPSGLSLRIHEYVESLEPLRPAEKQSALTRVRKERGLSQSKLAEMVGSSALFIHDLETKRDVRALVPLNTAVNLAKSLGVPLSEIFPEEANCL